jgi:hypothetical protein
MTRPTNTQSMVDELTSWHTITTHNAIREPGTWNGRDYHVKVAPLILQLEFSAEPTNTAAGTNSAFESRPAARLDAIDCMRTIANEAADHLTALGLPVPHDTITRVRRLHANGNPDDTDHTHPSGLVRP